ncbi:MAG: PAS domain S-box protein, partial [Anaerolineales bacterium]
MDLEISSPLNILLITDKQNDQEVYQSFFQDRKIPFSIGGVSPIHGAIVFLSSTPFDIVIVDSYTDWITVFELIQDFPGLPWFILTDKGNEEIAVQAFKTGAADCIIKVPENEYLPLLLDSIVHAIQQRDEKILTDQYHQQLEDIVADRTQVLMKSNQLLSDEASQRAQAIDDLKESREIYRRFFQTSRDAVFISSVDDRWIDMNQSALQLFGYQDREQIWNDSILDLYWDPEDREEYLKKITKQGFVKDYPLKFRKKDDTIFDALVSATPYEIGGKLIGYQGFIRDISDDIRAEEDKQSILKQQTVIDDLAIEMGTSLALKDIYQSIRTHVQDLFSMDGLCLYKYDREGQSIQAEFIWMNDKKAGIVDFTPARFDNLKPSLTTQVIQDKTGLNIANLQAYLQENNQESIKGNHPNESPPGKIQGLHFSYATLLAPIVVKEEVIGVLQVINQQPDVYSPDDLHILSRIAKVVAIGLQKAYLYQESLAHVKKLSSLQRIEQAILENLSL